VFTYKGGHRVWNPKYLGLINHFVYVVDMSGSMRPLRRAVAEFLDAQRRVHADMSERTGQETRFSVYLFDTEVECVIYDRDVLRAIDFDSILEARGTTALRDATMQAFRELKQTADLHGDHAFVLNALTDGRENASRRADQRDVREAIASTAANWSVTCFVPGKGHISDAVNRGGFPEDHVQVWDATVQGVQEMSRVHTAAADTFYAGRATGTRSFTSKALFGGGSEALNDATVQQAGLVEIEPARFEVYTMAERIEAKDFCEQKGYRYRNGVVFYEWFNTQPQKTVLFQRVRDGKVFSAPAGSTAARDLLGLDVQTTMRGKPAPNREYRRFIQSTAPNRKLIPGKHALILDATRV
jgi:hypothetical protein